MSTNNNQPPRNNGPNQNNSPRKKFTNGTMKTNLGQALAAGRRNVDTASKIMDIHKIAEVSPEKRANFVPLVDDGNLKITFLGGQDGVGEKNMQVVEYGDDALILDCGIDLSVDLPGINFGIPDTSYLEKIKHKIKGYVISHGHLDHIGALTYIVPNYPAPIYGTHFTIGMINRIFNDNERTIDKEFTPRLIEMKMDSHERLQVGQLTIELVRVTHAIPDSAAIVIDSPAGRILNTGDFRLDPEPLDHKPTDTERLIELGKEGVDILMSDSTGAVRPGRTPTESSLEKSIHDIIKSAPGRIFFASFSSNINRIQMVMDAAAASGRKVAIDGRSMLVHVELAVKLGLIRISKGTLAAVRQMPSLPDNKVLVICTGGQGEINASLQRMSIGEHKHIKLKSTDTVVVSSTPIPGNEIRYDQIADDITRIGCKIFRAPSHEVDGCGPLHVSGHASRDEYLDLLKMVKPKHFLPIYSGPLYRNYNVENAVMNGVMPKDRCHMFDNGDSVLLKDGKVKPGQKVPVGTVLVDDTGSVVSSVVVKDRLIMAEDGIVTVILTLEKGTGRLVSSPDIITRGFIYMRDNEELMNGIRAELRRAAKQRFSRVDIDRFKAELKDHVTHYLYEHTQRSPMVIAVVNIVGPNGEKLNSQPESAAVASRE